MMPVRSQCSIEVVIYCGSAQTLFSDAYLIDPEDTDLSISNPIHKQFAVLKEEET